MYNKTKRYFWLFLALLLTMPVINIYADGSRDLYPSEKEGRRAFLRSSNTATVVPCEELNIFWEDFGTSNFEENLGRTTSPYMPSESFTFGTPYPQSNVSNETAIDNDHYAVVAPGYIKAGWKTEDLGWYFWTPAYNEENTVTDRSGEVDGAVMVINAGNTLKPFYERHQLLQVGATYRASFWLYLMKGDSQVAIDVKHAKTGEVLATITSAKLEDWDDNVKSKWNYIHLYFTVPVPDDKENCEVDNVILSFRNNNAATFGNDYYIDDISLDKVCSPPPGTIIINCPDPEYKKNYWMGGKTDAPNDWDEKENWTGGDVPEPGEDIEFATVKNYGTPAVADLYVPEGNTKIIGSLINETETEEGKSEVRSLVIPPNSGLHINDDVEGSDDLSKANKIKVKTDKEDATGTLWFPNAKSNSDENPKVYATVEFYNKAYECADCGYFRKGWQYFGIPVASAEFPYIPNEQPFLETIHKWDEPTNGNKWITPTGDLEAFVGYEINNKSTTQPEHIYEFKGKLNVGDKTITLSKTSGVNYEGMNLIANSYTAAIPINKSAIVFGDKNEEDVVYLFNTGTRDQWRKLNGGTTPNVVSGTYTSVPLELGGQAGLPHSIPSMHTFMIEAKNDKQTLELKYNQLIKNEVGEGQPAWRSTQSEKQEIPHIVLDVIGSNSADRVWIFAKEGTTYGFDNGWDGRKMAESGIAQLYVAGTDESQLQVATVPSMNNVTLGFEADADGKYTLEFSLSEQLNTVEIHLQDLVTGTSQRLSDGGSYQFEAKKGDTAARFRLSQSGEFTVTGDEALIDIEPVGDGKVMIRNRSGNACTAFLSNDKGAVLQRVEVSAGGEEVLENMSAGVYVVRLQNATVNDVRRVIVE